MEPRRILVPVNGDASDEDAVRLACNLAKKNKGVVFVLNVVEVARALPLDSPDESAMEQGEEILQRMESIGKHEKCTVEGELLQAREAGPAVVEEARERQADLIIMGLCYKKRRGEFNLGDTIPHVLKQAECAVWVSRAATANGHPTQQS